MHQGVRVGPDTSQQGEAHLVGHLGANFDELAMHSKFESHISIVIYNGRELQARRQVCYASPPWCARHLMLS